MRRLEEAGLKTPEEVEILEAFDLADAARRSGARWV